MMTTSETSLRPAPAITPLGNGSQPLEHWDLLVLGEHVQGLAEALEAANFQGRVGLVEQRLTSASAAPPRSGGAPADALQRFLAAARKSPPSWPFPTSATPTSPPGAAPAIPPEPAPATPAAAPPSWELVAIPGWSVFTGPHTLAVHGREVAFHRAILATGARDDRDAIAGLAETGFVTPDTLDELRELPKRVAILGATPRACELAQAFRRYGSEVFLVSDDERLLADEEPLAAGAVTRALAELGVRLHLGWQCTAAASTGRARSLVIAQGSAQRKLIVDQIVLALPRRANLERLGLAAAGIQLLDRDGRAAVQVDSRLATTNPRVFAVGDVCGSFRGPEALARMCEVAVQNAVGVTRPRFEKSLVPRFVATDPEIAQLGLTRAAARTRKIELLSWLVPFADDEAPRQLRADEGAGDADLPGLGREFALLHTLRDQPDRVAGATVVGARAAEALALIALMMAEELPLSTASGVPTLSGTFGRALARLSLVVEQNWRAPAG